REQTSLERVPSRTEARDRPPPPRRPQIRRTGEPRPHAALAHRDLVDGRDPLRHVAAREPLREDDLERPGRRRERVLRAAAAAASRTDQRERAPREKAEQHEHCDNRECAPKRQLPRRRRLTAPATLP